MKDQKLPLNCPDCAAFLFFDNGQEQTFDEPGSPATVYCQDCGYERSPEHRDIQIKSSDRWYIRANPLPSKEFPYIVCIHCGCVFWTSGPRRTKVKYIQTRAKCPVCENME